MNVVFARPESLVKDSIRSYSDFFDLVELSRYESCYIREIDLDRDCIYIICPVNAQIRILDEKLARPRKAKLIFWNLERSDSGPYELSKVGSSGASNSTKEIWNYVDAVWVSDRHYASLHKKLTYVTLGSDPYLAYGQRSESPSYDIATLTYNNDRRREVYGPLSRHWKMAPESAWGDDRARILNSSKCMVYVHQTPIQIGSPLRFALAAAYKLPLISETMADPYPLLEDFDVVMCRKEEMVQRVDTWLSEGWLSELGKNLHQTLCVNLPFKKCVEEGISRSFR